MMDAPGRLCPPEGDDRAPDAVGRGVPAGLLGHAGDAGAGIRPIS